MSNYKQVLTKIARSPDNGTCVDCDFAPATWASINLGVFLCMNCAGVHRSLGTHITQVRSIELDKWTPEMVQGMQRITNKEFNRYYEYKIQNPPATPPPSATGPKRTNWYGVINNAPTKLQPMAPDDERTRYIRNKYEARMFYGVPDTSAPATPSPAAATVTQPATVTQAARVLDLFGLNATTTPSPTSPAVVSPTSPAVFSPKPLTMSQSNSSDKPAAAASSMFQGMSFAKTKPAVSPSPTATGPSPTAASPVPSTTATSSNTNANFTDLFDPLHVPTAAQSSPSDMTQEMFGIPATSAATAASPAAAVPVASPVAAKPRFVPMPTAQTPSANAAAGKTNLFAGMGLSRTASNPAPAAPSSSTSPVVGNVGTGASAPVTAGTGVNALNSNTTIVTTSDGRKVIHKKTFADMFAANQLPVAAPVAPASTTASTASVASTAPRAFTARPIAAQAAAKPVSAEPDVFAALDNLSLHAYTAEDAGGDAAVPVDDENDESAFAFLNEEAAEAEEDPFAHLLGGEGEGEAAPAAQSAAQSATAGTGDAAGGDAFAGLLGDGTEEDGEALAVDSLGEMTAVMGESAVLSTFPASAVNLDEEALWSGGLFAEDDDSSPTAAAPAVSTHTSTAIVEDDEDF